MDERRKALVTAWMAPSLSNHAHRPDVDERRKALVTNPLNSGMTPNSACPDVDERRKALVTLLVCWFYLALIFVPTWTNAERHW